MRRVFALLAVLTIAGCAAPASPPAAQVWTPALAAAVEPTVNAKRPEATDDPANDSTNDHAKDNEACAPVDPLDVLLIGNSYVIQSDTPAFLRAIAADARVDVHVERLAKGGKNFAYHLGRAKTRETLAARQWDVVFLQSHSLDPLRDPDGFADAGAGLIDAVRSAGAEPMLFETWPRRADHNLYNYMEEVGKTPAEMLARVTEQYANLGKRHGVRVAKVGTAWARLLRDHPQVRPYLKDGAHPAEAGAYLSAAVLFTLLTERDPRPVLKPHGAVDASEVAAIGEVAAAVVAPRCTW